MSAFRFVLWFLVIRTILPVFPKPSRLIRDLFFQEEVKVFLILCYLVKFLRRQIEEASIDVHSYIFLAFIKIHIATFRRAQSTGKGQQFRRLGFPQLGGCRIDQRCRNTVVPLRSSSEVDAQDLLAVGIRRAAETSDGAARVGQPSPAHLTFMLEYPETRVLGRFGRNDFCVGRRSEGPNLGRFITGLHWTTHDVRFHLFPNRGVVELVIVRTNVKPVSTLLCYRVMTRNEEAIYYHSRRQKRFDVRDLIN